MDFISILTLPFVLLAQKFLKFYKELNGNILLYLIVLAKLLWKKLRSGRDRFDLYDPFCDEDLNKLGLRESEQEWVLDRPRQQSNENLFVYGINSEGQALVLILKNRNRENDSRIMSSLKCMFRDSENDVYLIDEEDCNDRYSNDYSSCGIHIEVLSPMRRLRIRISSYMKKISANNELVYVRARFMWFALSNVFDYQNDCDIYFMAKQVARQSNSWSATPETENCFEQFGQLKGTVQVEQNSQKEVFLWGIKNKKLIDRIQQNTVYKIHGYVPNKGIGFNIRISLNYKNNHRYFSGVFFQQSISPITNLTIDESSGSFPKKFKFESNKKEYEVVLSDNDTEQLYFDFNINGIAGKAVVLRESEDSPIEYKKEINDEFLDMNNNNLVISLTHKFASRVSVSGGKGSSLHQLIKLSNQTVNQSHKNDEFVVPMGCIVTTDAYQLVSNLEEMKREIDNIEKVEKFIWIKDKSIMKNRCLKLEDMVSQLEMPQLIKDNISKNLLNTFKDRNIDSIQFSVRSSATAEDSEEMSWAGQMKTYLGVKGLDNIYSSVMKCWASQFNHIAMEYKLEYGQPINVLMAVVIQEMVDCECAGVAFSCDPITGDQRNIVITANYGLGESVVSSMAEPDTITLKVNINNNSFETRTIAGIESISIGSKRSSIRMTETGTLTSDQSNDEALKCCIPEDLTLKLGRVVLRVQKYFGSVRDIEWGIKEEKIYLLQSRPLTNLSSFSEWELMHQLDSPHLSDNEYSTRANIGEVLPGSCSYLSLTSVQNISGVCSFRALHESTGLPIKQFCPYRAAEYRIAYNQGFVSLDESEFLKTEKDGKLSQLTRAIIIAMFGHDLDDQQMIKKCGEKHTDRKVGIYYKIKSALSLINKIWNSKRLLDKCEKKYENFDLLKGKYFSNAKEMFDHLQNSISATFQPYNTHIDVSQASAIYNLMILNMLSISSNTEEPNKNLYSDFANLLSSCNDVVSADVPKDLCEIVESIDDKDSLKEMSLNEILEWLNNTGSRAGVLFKQFLSKHGHRCYGEFDIYKLSWRDDPIKVVQSIKAMLSATNRSKKQVSTDSQIDSLKTPISWLQKFLLKHLLLRWCTDMVGLRERSKSFLIWVIDRYRIAYWELARRLVYEQALLPDPELMFYLTSGEIDELLSNRKSSLILRAMQRKRVFSKMNDFRFDEIVYGPNIKPTNLDVSIPNLDGINSLKGLPVSNGKVKARVCVAHTLEDAVNIKPGDILITYSTDIAWSPYFPLIGGLVTEVGGLISHGAVIAREYGLPCIIACKNACSLFSDGDTALLDSEQGTITKISS